MQNTPKKTITRYRIVSEDGTIVASDFTREQAEKDCIFFGEMYNAEYHIEEVQVPDNRY